MAIWMKERKREIEKLQRKWIEGINPNAKELIIVSADGKTMRGSNNKELNEKARHIVSLFL